MRLEPERGASGWYARLPRDPSFRRGVKASASTAAARYSACRGLSRRR